MGWFSNAISSVVQVAAAPITAPIAAVRSVVAGDNVLAAAKNAAITTTAALNPISYVEAAAGTSPTGFGAVATGSTDSDDQKRFLISSAIGAAAAGGAAYLGGAALATSGTAAAATGGTAAVGGLSASAIGSAALPLAVGAAKNALTPKPENAVTTAASATRSPASDLGGVPLPILIGGGFLILVLILNRKA